jgi:hypothetical protein
MKGAGEYREFPLSCLLVRERESKGLEEFSKLINSKASLADQGSQGAWLEFFSPARNTEVTPIRMIKRSQL